MIVAGKVMRWLPLMFDSKKGSANPTWAGSVRELRLPLTVQKPSTLLHNSKLSLGVNACLPCQPCDKPATWTRCTPPSPCDSRARLQPPCDHKHSRISRDRKQVDGQTIRGKKCPEPTVTHQNKGLFNGVFILKNDI